MSLMLKKRFKAEANMNSRIMKTFLIFISTLYKSWGAVRTLHVHQPISTKLIIAPFDGGKAVLHLPSCFQVGNMLQASPHLSTCRHEPSPALASALNLGIGIVHEGISRQAFPSTSFRGRLQEKTFWGGYPFFFLFASFFCASSSFPLSNSWWTSAPRYVQGLSSHWWTSLKLKHSCRSKYPPLHWAP